MPGGQQQGQHAGQGMPIIPSLVSTAADTTDLPKIAPSPHRTPGIPPPPYETVADGTQSSSGEILAARQKRHPKAASVHLLWQDIFSGDGYVVAYGETAPQPHGRPDTLPFHGMSGFFI